jgi:DNA-binding transcriptional MerR regulator
MIRIGDFARLGNVSVRTLRFYDQTRLLKPLHVDPASGYRHYQASQLTLLQRIRGFQDLGFSLWAIRELLRRDLPASELHALIAQRHADLQRQIHGDLRRLERIAISLQNLGNGRSVASQVLVRETKESWVVSLREKIRGYDEADQMFSELERRVPAHLLTAQRSALWHSCAGERGPIDCEVMRCLKRPIKLGRGMRTYQLRAGTAASVFHAGGEETMGESYRTLTRWLSSSGFRLDGAKREIYWVEPDTKTKAESLTEIQFPIAANSVKRNRFGRAA